jgi:hypothetical protein
VYSPFSNLDLPGHSAVRFDGYLGEMLPPSDRSIVPKQDALGPDRLDQSLDDQVLHRLESRRQDLHDEPPVVAVNHEGRNSVAFAMYDAIRIGIDALPAIQRGTNPLGPPAGIQGTFRNLQQPETDFGFG